MTLHREIAGRFNARFGPGRRRSGAGRATLLMGGAAEPVYLPGTADRPAVIRYTLDFAASALHEIAHWCLADAAARRRVDYGLGYEPPPRSAAAQARFYAAEVPVQALELLLCRACGVPFNFSADNPGADGGPARRRFEVQVLEAHELLQSVGPNRRTRAVLAALNPVWDRPAALRS